VTLSRLLPATLALLLSGTAVVAAQHIPGYNYDEAKIPPYTLLDPLKTAGGAPVTTATEWGRSRRPEIVHLFEENVFGRTPANAHVLLRAHLVEQDRAALQGRAIRKQIDLYFTPVGAPREMKMRLLLYLPAHAAHPLPVILGLNFGGNQTVLDDPAIQPTPVWTAPKPALTLLHEPPADSTRGTQIQEWQVEKIIAHGYGLATAYYGDIEPDFKDASQYSIRQLFLRPGQTTPDPDEWGAIGAWAWGLSRALDYLETDPDVDARHVAVTGHSRLGKVADWAAAQDLRFAAVLSTESGKGGQSLSRREIGETVQHLEHSFPYWFCANYAQWVGHDQQIPADGNLLIALIAPRPLYVASAAGDEWSDPRGEFLSALSASRVYDLLGAHGLPVATPMPALDQALLNDTVAYHVRTGKHDVTAFDWDQYLRFLDIQFAAPPVLPDPKSADPQLATRPATDAQIKRWRKQMRNALFIPDPLPKVEPETYGSFTPTPGVLAERVSYRTEYGLRVPAIVYRPASPPKGKMPGLVLVNGHGGDKSSWYSYYTGIVYARAGAVVVTYDPIGDGESNDDRKAGADEHDRIIDVPTMPARMGGRMITDVMQAVSYLSERKDVDPKRIGVFGFSMGSFIAALSGAADPRIHALLLTGGGDLDGPGGYWDSSHAVMCQSGPYKALAFLGDRPAVLYTLNARRGSTFILNGTNDTVVDIPHHEQDFFDALRQRVIALNGSTRGVFETSFDPGASHRPNWMTRIDAEWLDRNLHFPNWPQQPVDTVSALPVEPMRSWAEHTGYALSKSSGREDRDAGLEVVEADVPLLTQDQLNLFTPDEWQEHKAEFLYSNWTAKALADAAATH